MRLRRSRRILRVDVAQQARLCDAGPVRLNASTVSRCPGPARRATDPSPPDRPGRTCELSSIAVRLKRVDAAWSSLIQAFLSEAWSLDSQCVHLTTDADRNHWPTHFTGTQDLIHPPVLQHKGRWMNEYVIERPAAADRRGVRP